jgi:hypothetical protein
MGPLLCALRRVLGNIPRAYRFVGKTCERPDLSTDGLAIAKSR